MAKRRSPIRGERSEKEPIAKVLQHQKSMRTLLLKWLEGKPTGVLNTKQIATEVGIETKDTEMVNELYEALMTMSRDGLVDAEGKGKFRPKLVTNFVDGKIDITKTGAAYLIVEDREEDIYIPANKMKNALHGDLVRVELNWKRSSRKQEGEVSEILQRAKMIFTGVLDLSDKYGFVVVDSKRMHVDIFIPLSQTNGAKNGEKVVVEIEKWPENSKSPQGKVTRVLGMPGEHNTEMHAIIAEFQLPEDFSAELEAIANAIPEAITEEEIKKRRDMRGELTFTIDPADAKDFDDALSFKKLDDGNYEIGIHIADVSHYVKEGSALDKEAQERATSVYLVDRVIPMLPEKLSNDLCSLRPNEDKLTYSVVVTMNASGIVEDKWIGRTIIHSDRRFSYEQAQELLEQNEALNKEDNIYWSALHTLNSLAYKMRDRRFADGAISFETEEVKFNLSETGKPLGVYRKVRKDAHKLIEDFMLLANEVVAKAGFDKVKDKKIHAFVYRVHDTPDPDKVANFGRIAAQFGYKVNHKTPRTIAQSLNEVMAQSDGKPEHAMLQSLAIRSMAKAVYTGKKSGHYGLAFDYYTHFTSPIRRYPDVMVHRQLTAIAKGVKGEGDEELEILSKHSTDREIRAAEAERASIKYKQVEYLSERIGQVFEGLISGVTEWGIFVELVDSKCEGMVRINQMRGDTYVWEEDKFLVRGVRNGKTYRLGDMTQVKVVATNLSARNIDFEFYDENEPEGAAPSFSGFQGRSGGGRPERSGGGAGRNSGGGGRNNDKRGGGSKGGGGRGGDGRNSGGNAGGGRGSAKTSATNQGSVNKNEAVNVETQKKGTNMDNQTIEGYYGFADE